MDLPGLGLRLRARGLRLVVAAVALVAVTAVVLGLVVTVTRGEIHSGGDPQGRMLAQLRPVASAIPPDAQVLQREEREPVWTTCGGEPRSGGWTWVDVSVNFETSLPPDAVMDAVNRQLSRTGGWTGGWTG